MKKISLAVITVFTLVCCKKQTLQKLENFDNTKSEVSVKIQDGRLIFPSEELYDNYFQPGENEVSVKTKIAKSDFVSFFDARNESSPKTFQRNIKEKCVIPDELIENNPRFFNLLNKDGILQVGDYVFRYDYCNDGVWFINKTNFLNKESYNKFLSGELSKDVVGFFPSDVDAFAALEKGYTTMPDKGSAGYLALKNEESSVSPNAAEGGSVYENFYIHNLGDGSVDMDGKLSYDKFAVYFNFYGKEKYQLPCSLGWCTASTGDRTWKVDYYYRCRRKGLSYDYTGSATTQPPIGGENKLETIFYDGSRGLLNLDATWKVYNVSSNYRKIERKFGAFWTTIVAGENYGAYILTDNFNNIPGFPQGSPLGIHL